MRSTFHCVCRSFKDGQTPPPKLVVTTCSDFGDKTYIDRLKNTLLHSEQMVRGPRCPVWVIDANSTDAEHSLFSNEYPNYLVVKFFAADRMERPLKTAAAAAAIKDDRVKLENIRDQVGILRN